MNRFFSLAAALLLCVNLLPGCSKDKKNTDSKQAGEPLIVACEPSFSPYCYLQTGDLNSPVAGIDIDMVEAIAKELNRPVKYIKVPFPQIFSQVSMGKADIGVGGITITRERAERVLFSTPYDTSYQVMVVPRASSLTTTEMLKNARLGVQEGTTNYEFAKLEIKPKEIIQFLTHESLAQALLDRQVDAAVMDILLARVLVENTGDTLKVVEKPLTNDEFGFVFNKENPELCKAGNTVITRLKQSGFMGESISRHSKVIYDLQKKRSQIKPFVVCVETGFAPFVFLSRDKIQGVDIEMAEAIAEQLGRPLEIKTVPFVEIMPLVMSGAADMGAAGISITPNRAAMVLFSEPYEKNVRRILVPEGSDIDEFEDLIGIRIGVKRGTTNADYVRANIKSKELHEFGNAAAAIRALLNGDIDAYVDDETSANITAGKYVGQLIMLNIALPVEDYGYVFRLGNTAAKEAADRVIQEKRENGDLQALFRKYNSLAAEGEIEVPLHTEKPE